MIANLSDEVEESKYCERSRTTVLNSNPAILSVVMTVQHEGVKQAQRLDKRGESLTQQTLPCRSKIVILEFTG